MPYSQHTQTGIAAQQVYSFPFDTLDSDYITCLVDGTEATSYTVDRVNNEVTIVTPAIAGGEDIYIFRSTGAGDADRKIVPTNLAALSEVELNKLQLQLLHLIQENLDGIAGVEGGLIVGGPGGSPIPLLPGTEGQRLTSHGNPGALTWESEAGSNEGTGVGVFKDINPTDGATLRFKTLVSADASVIIDGTDPDEIDLSASGVGEDNTASNVGAGAEVYKEKVGVDLRFRSLVSAGSPITVTQNADEIEISSSAEANTASNVGGEVEVFKEKSGVDLRFRTIQSSDASLTITQNADDIDIVSAGGGGGGDVFLTGGWGNSGIGFLSNAFAFRMPSGYDIAEVDFFSWTTGAGGTGTRNYTLRHGATRGTSLGSGTAVHAAVAAGMSSGTSTPAGTTTITSQPADGDMVWCEITTDSGTNPTQHTVTVRLTPS